MIGCMTNLRLDNIYNASHILLQAQYDIARAVSLSLSKTMGWNSNRKFVIHPNDLNCQIQI